MQPTIVISACLLGDSCRYDGTSKTSAAVCSLANEIEARGGLVQRVCPEVSAGLPCPRSAAELQPDGRVMTVEGRDVTDEFETGAAHCLHQALEAGATVAILKDGSPSCGSRFVYDGSFSGVQIKGQGLFAKRLREAGLEVLGETETEAVLSILVGLTDS